MIVRIMGEGQYDLPDDSAGALEAYDDAVSSALAGDDDDAFRSALAATLAEVRAAGQLIDDETLRGSDVVLPGDDATLAEVREFVADEGLLPG